MKRSTVLVACLCLVIQPYLALAESSPIAGADTRIYLADGSLIEGTLVEKDKDLIIIRVKDQIFTFDKAEIDKIITLESLGGGARNITVTEFPYISFLGGAVAFSLLSWLQFDRASDNDREAALNREHGQLARAQKLDDKASRARLYGWSTAPRGVADPAQNPPPRLSRTQYPRRRADHRRVLRLPILNALPLAPSPQQLQLPHHRLDFGILQTDDIGVDLRPFVLCLKGLAQDCYLLEYLFHMRVLSSTQGVWPQKRR